MMKTVFRVVMVFLLLSVWVESAFAYFYSSEESGTPISNF
jgi:hypothetical protein